MDISQIRTHAQRCLDAKISSYGNFPSHEGNKHIPKVANSSMNPMTSIKEPLAWKPGKIHTP
jgi:hypothetical protein